MGALLSVLLRILSFLGLGFLQVAKSSIAGIIAALAWVATHLTERAAMFLLLRAVLLLGITRCVSFFVGLISGFVKPQISGKIGELWEASQSAGSLLPGAIVNTLNLPYVIETLIKCGEVWLACFAFRILVYEARFMVKFAGVSVKS